MTIKISELNNLSAFSDSTLIPVVGNVLGIATTLKAEGTVLKTYITSEINANISNLQNDITILYANAATQSGQIVTANINMKGYVDAINSTLTANAGSQADQIDNLWANAGSQASQISSLIANAGSQSDQIITANINMKGYVDEINSTLTANAAVQAGEIAALYTNAAIQAGQIANIAADTITISELVAEYSPNLDVSSYFTVSPLTAAQGGTGLNSSGTLGNILTSTGNGWVSSGVVGIGIDQTWQDLTSARAADATYTNNTGKPITVNITIYKVGSSTPSICYVNSVQVAYVDGSGTGDNGVHSTVSFVVPANSTYRVTNEFLYWAELR